MDSDHERRLMSQPATPATQPAEPRQQAEAVFHLAHPRYGETTVLDDLRRSDFARLDAGGHVYLDYTGAGLYADSQLREHLELLRSNVRAHHPTVSAGGLGANALVSPMPSRVERRAGSGRSGNPSGRVRRSY